MISTDCGYLPAMNGNSGNGTRDMIARLSKRYANYDEDQGRCGNETNKTANQEIKAVGLHLNTPQK